MSSYHTRQEIWQRGFYVGLLSGAIAIAAVCLFVSAAVAEERPDDQKWHIGQTEASTGYYCATIEGAVAGLKEVRILSAGDGAFTLDEGDPKLNPLGCAYVINRDVTFLGRVPLSERVKGEEGTWAFVRWQVAGREVFSWLREELISTKKVVDKSKLDI